jgi:hypothetical protein
MHGGNRIGAGRRKGAQSRASVEIRSWCRELAPEVLDRLKLLVYSSDGPTAIRACAIILAYGFGKPHTRVEASGIQSAPIHFTLDLGKSQDQLGGQPSV